MSSRGVLGTLQQKPRPQNVNSVYSGKNTAAGKASGPSKHGGLQALGKTTTIVRRMPPPATLPSLKSEYADDPCLVPAGGQGWSKSNHTSDNGNQKLAHSASAGDFKANGSDTSAESSFLSAMASGSGPDLRPNWAKPAQAPGNNSGSQASLGTAAAPAPLSDVQSQTAATVQVYQPTPPPNSTAAEAANNREFPTLAASVAVKSSGMAASADYGSLKPQKNWVGGMGQAQAKGEDISALIVPVTTTALSSSAGYIGASVPKTVSGRKLPERYCGEVTRQNSSQKYDWQQKMARLSLEAKEQRSGGLTVSSSNTSTGTDRGAQHAGGVKPELGAGAASPETVDASAQRRGSEDYQQLAAQPATQVQDARHYPQPHTPASDSTGGGGPAIVREHQTSYGGEQHEGEPDPRSSSLVGQQHPSEQHASGRRDIGYAMGQPPTDPQHQPNRHYDAARPILGDPTYEHGGNAVQQPQHHRYDEPPPPVVGTNTPPSYRRNGEVAMPDIFEETACRRYTASSPTPPISGGGSWGGEEQKVHGNRYRPNNRHTSESDNGWYGPLNNVQQQQSAYNARQGSSNYQPDQKQDQEQQQQNTWYGSAQPAAAPPNHPPSLLTMETIGPSDMYKDGRLQGRIPYNPSSNYYQPLPFNSRSRNGSLTYAASEEGCRAVKGKASNRRTLGTEVSSASENDSQHEAGATPYSSSSTKYDSFFSGNEPADKNYWEDRGSQQQQPVYPQQQQKILAGKPEQTPMIRMLKRNDEKSAEYFAHHATVLPSQYCGTVNCKEMVEDEDDEFNATIPLTQLSQGQSTRNNYKKSEVASDTGKQAGKSSARPQTASYQRRGAGQQATEESAGSGQQFSQRKQNQQHNGTGGKFNRVPGEGGGKSNAPQPNNRQPANHQDSQPSKSASPTAPTSVANSSNKLAAPVTIAQPPVDNVWEKRMEEREKPNTTYPQSKPNSQFDYHFPSMSDAAKQEAEALAAAETLDLFGSQQARYQDVRIEQQHSSRGVPSRHADNQWNPLTSTHTVSHWNDDFSSSNKEGGRRQRNHKSNEQGGEAAFHFSQDHIFNASDNTYEGNRREFVNSSKGPRFTANGGSTKRSQMPLRGGTKQVGRNQTSRGGGDAPAHTANRPAAGKHGRQHRGLQQPAATNSAAHEKLGSQLRPSVKEPGLNAQPEEKDNFSNMDVFHAEDYHIEPATDGSYPTPNTDFTGQSADGGSKGGSSSARRGNKRTNADSHYANETSSNHPRPNNRGGRSSANSGVYVNRNWRSGDQPNTRPLNNKTERTTGEVSTPCEEPQELVVHKQGGNRAAQKRSTGNTRPNATIQHARGAASRQRNPTKATRYKTDSNANNTSSSSNRHLADTAGQLKSPVISDGGVAEEWETASESSDFAERTGRMEEESESNHQSGHTSNNTHLGFERKENMKKPAGSSGKNTKTGHRGHPKLVHGDNASEQHNTSSITTAKSQQTRSTGQKNVKPASHTYQGSSAKSNNNNNSKARSALYTHKQHSNNTKNARDDRKGSDVQKNGMSNHFSARDGLAGVDINNASVVIIDYHPDGLLNSSVGGSRDESEAGDFEEVLSKRSKRQRLSKLEEKRKKEQLEKERQERIQAKRSKQQQQQHRRKAEKGGSAPQNETSADDHVHTKPKEDCSSKSDPPVSVVEPSPLMLSTALFNTNSCGNVSKSSNVSPTTTKPAGGLNGLGGSSLHDVTSNSTTVWNDSHTLNTMNDFCTTLNGPVIPSPIARPIRVLNDNIRKSSTYSSSKSLTAIEKPELDFTNYDPLKTEGGSEPTKRATSSASKSPIGVDEGSRSHQRQHSNDDHAQLQKKLDKVKNFWPGSSSTSTDQPLDHQQNGGQKNSPKEVIGKKIIDENASTTISSVTSSSITANGGQREHSNHQNTSGAMLPQFGSGGQQPALATTRSKVTMESFPPTTTNTPQSPITSTLFGNALFTLGGPAGPTNMTPYSIMMGSNGEQKWFKAPHPPHHHHHPANSPPSQNPQHILSNATNHQPQRSSRPNSFVEQQHGFHATTPWSTNCGLEYLNGIGATPPPLSGPTPVLFQQQSAKSFSQQPPPALRMSSITHSSSILAVSGGGHPPGAALQQGFTPPNNMIRATQLAHMAPPPNVQHMGTHFMPATAQPLDLSMPPPQFFPPPNNRPQHMPNGFAPLPPPQPAVPPINFSAPPPPFSHQPIPMNLNGSAFGRNCVLPPAVQPLYNSSSNGAMERQKRLVVNKQLQIISSESNQRGNDSMNDSKKSPTNANCGTEIGNASTVNSNSGYGLFK